MPSSFVRSTSSPATRIGLYNPMTASRGKAASPFSMDTQNQMENILGSVGGQKGLVSLFQSKMGPDMGAAALMQGAQGLMTGGPLAGLGSFLMSAFTGGIDQKRSQRFGQELMNAIGIGQSGQTFTNTGQGIMTPQDIFKAAYGNPQQSLAGTWNPYAGNPQQRYQSLMQNRQQQIANLANPQFGKLLSSVQDYY